MSRFSGPYRLSKGQVDRILSARQRDRLVRLSAPAWQVVRSKVTDEFAREDDALRRAVWDAEDDAARWGMKRD